MSSSHRQRLAFPDLATTLMRHTWLVLLYTVLCVVSIYVLGHFATDVLIFAAIQLPTVIAVSATTYSSKQAFPRIPFVWLTTAVLVLALLADRKDHGWAPMTLALSALLLIAYCIWRAIAGTVREYGQRRHLLGLPETVAVLIASWGATLQISLLGLLAIRGDMSELLDSTEAGKFLVEGLRFVASTSPTTWFPTALLALGITILAALRFQDDPYHPLNLEEVLPTSSTGILSVFFTALRLPTWIVRIILGFLVHFVRQAWLSIRFFLDDWLGRLVFIVFAVIIPILGLSAGHLCYWKTAGIIYEHMSESPHDFWPTVLILVATHAFVVAALSLYAISASPLLMNVRPAPLREAARAVAVYASREILGAANAIGRVFSLFGIIIVALPIASLLPGLPHFGPFSMTYSAFVVLALGYVLVHEAIRETATSPQDQS